MLSWSYRVTLHPLRQVRDLEASDWPNSAFNLCWGDRERHSCPAVSQRCGNIDTHIPSGCRYSVSHIGHYLSAMLALFHLWRINEGQEVTEDVSDKVQLSVRHTADVGWHCCVCFCTLDDKFVKSVFAPVLDVCIIYNRLTKLSLRVMKPSVTTV